MTTEEDFQSQLDDCRNSHHTRLIFADWLDEHDDPRAEGYRVLGQIQWYPYSGAKSSFVVANFVILRLFDKDGLPDMSALPLDWFKVLTHTYPQQANIYRQGLVNTGLQMRLGSDADKADKKEVRCLWISFNTRREAEDAAVMAFTKLPIERRAELVYGKDAGLLV